MADTTLHFKLGSTFDGSGFTAASKEIQNAAKQGKQLSGALGNVLGEAQKLEGGLGKVAGAAGNVVTGFSQMGIIGGIVAGAKSAMDLFFDSAKAGYDKMVKAAQEGAARQQKAMQKTVDAMTDGVRKGNDSVREFLNGTIKQFDETAQAAVKASQLIAQTDIARANNSIAKVQVEKLNAIIKEETDAGKALVAAKYDLKIAEMKAAQSEERGVVQTDAERKAILTSQERLKLAHDGVAKAEKQLAEAREKERLQSYARSADTSKIHAEVKAAEKALNDARKEVTQSTRGVAEAEERLKAVEIGVATERMNQEAAVLQAKLALEKANLALEKANEAEEKAAKARLKEAEEAEKAARKLAAQKSYDDQAGFIQGLGEQQIGQLTADIKKMREEIEQIGKDMGRVREGVETDAKVKNGTFGTYQYRLDGNGNPDNFIDWQRAMRFAERAERDRATREKRDSAFQKKMQDLQDKLDRRGEKALTDREKEALKRWNEYQEQKTGRERREAEIKQKQDRIDGLRQQIAKDVKETREMIQQCLEVQ